MRLFHLTLPISMHLGFLRLLDLALKTHVSHPHMTEKQNYCMYKAVILICKSNQMHLFSRFFFVVFFTLKLTLPASILKVNVSSVCCAIFTKQQRKNICELLLFLYTTMHFNCWEEEKKAKKKESSNSWILIHPQKNPNMFCCIIPFIHHGS